MPNQYWAEVISHENLVAEFWLLTLRNEELARAAKPGQFLHIKVSAGNIPLLRRPISIHDIDGTKIKILYQVVGEGTRLLTNFKAGDHIDVMGPLGNGFDISKHENRTPAKKIAVVAGGIGVAPLNYLVRELVNKGNEVILYQGARSGKLLIAKNLFEKMNLRYQVATDDGSEGYHGLVIDLLQEDLTKGLIDEIYACGPHPMLKAVAEMATSFNVPSQISLEERMGCATGACLSCVCKVKISVDGINNWIYKKVCVEGPVFNGQEVHFDEA